MYNLNQQDTNDRDRSKCIDRRCQGQRPFCLHRVHDEFEQSVGFLKQSAMGNVGQIMMIENFIKHAERLIHQIIRRVIKCGKIPHREKVFSIFEEHTEWISKGKAGIPQELGLKVCVLEDQYGFILHHHVMVDQTDDQIAVAMIADTQKKHNGLTCCSFDKGFHSPENQQKLKSLLDQVVLQRKGRLSKKARQIENSEDFIHARRKHGAVESAINALENHGLDCCPTIVSMDLYDM